jgi:hypothetical protein
VEAPYESGGSHSSLSARLLAEAKATPGGWVYSIDAAYTPDGTDGRVPFEGIIGAWKVADNGMPTVEYWANPDYGSSPPAQ